MKPTLGKAAFAACLLTAGAAAQAAAYGNCNKLYEVIITNMTLAQILSPPLAVAHRPSIHLYQIGEPASEGLAALAEGGDTSTLTDELSGEPGVCDAVTATDPVLPGGSVRLTLHGSNHRVLSIASMLVNTNDAFAALDGMPLPITRAMATRVVPAYDAGSEVNDESCDHVPGPACGGEGINPEGGEGFVHVHRGVHGVDALDAAEYDWRNPVARIEVRRIN